MGEVKRYLNDGDLLPDGREFVLASAYDTLRTERDRLEREVSELRTRCDNFMYAINAKQAKIDALMLEFCPGEMSAEQKAEWAANQRAALKSEPQT
jgi:hypothetical protein